MPIEARICPESPGIVTGSFGFSWKPRMRSLVSTCMTPKWIDSLAAIGREADGEVGFLLDVGAKHVAVIHLVDMITGQDQDVLRCGLLDCVDVLVDGIGCPLVPLLVEPLLGRQDINVFLQFPAQVAPPGGDVAI